ncbi:hypothetical protein [Massilia consociata]|uniref:Uncharacterized protein n=1 Tax=Massilia consociata TaxID=760117 RepID=A0ABV6FIK7_9BURK
MRDTHDEGGNGDGGTPSGRDGAPKFGRLLLVLLFALLMVVAITFGSEAYFT